MITCFKKIAMHSIVYSIAPDWTCNGALGDTILIFFFFTHNCSRKVCYANIIPYSAEKCHGIVTHISYLFYNPDMLNFGEN